MMMAADKTSPVAPAEWMEIARVALMAAAVTMRTHARTMGAGKSGALDAAADYVEAIADQYPRGE